MSEELGSHINVDLTNIPENEIKGVFTVKIVKTELQKAKTDGSTNLYVEMELVDAEDLSGRKVWTTLNLKPQSLWRVRDFVQACGVFPGANGFDKNELMGKMLRVIVEMENYEGRNRPKVKDFAPLT